METIELGAGSYPEPQDNTKTVHIEITMTVSNDIEVPIDWDEERIRDDIRANLGEYFDNGTEENWEVEIDGAKKIDRKIKLKVEKSDFPDEEGTHLLVQYTATEHGYGYRRLFKGTYKECIDKKNELEDLKNGAKRKNTRISRAT